MNRLNFTPISIFTGPYGFSPAPSPSPSPSPEPVTPNTGTMTSAFNEWQISQFGPPPRLPLLPGLEPRNIEEQVAAVSNVIGQDQLRAILVAEQHRNNLNALRQQIGLPAIPSPFSSPQQTGSTPSVQIAAQPTQVAAPALPPMKMPNSKANTNTVALGILQKIFTKYADPSNSEDFEDLCVKEFYDSHKRVPSGTTLQNYNHYKKVIDMHVNGKKLEDIVQYIATHAKRISVPVADDLLAFVDSANIGELIKEKTKPATVEAVADAVAALVSLSAPRSNKRKHPGE